LASLGLVNRACLDGPSHRHDWRQAEVLLQQIEADLAGLDEYGNDDAQEIN
jgi:hypothetical protein